jgi:hypothetical protein
MLTLRVQTNVFWDFPEKGHFWSLNFFSPKKAFLMFVFHQNCPFLRKCHTFSPSGLRLGIYAHSESTNKCVLGFSGNKSILVPNFFLVQKGFFLNQKGPFLCKCHTVSPSGLRLGIYAHSDGTNKCVYVFFGKRSLLSLKFF